MTEEEFIKREKYLGNLIKRLKTKRNKALDLKSKLEVILELASARNELNAHLRNRFKLLGLDSVTHTNL